jgi:hypothetical protein
MTNGVHVDEVRLHAALEVLVGDVAPADHRHHPVGDEELVMHPVVEPAEVEYRRDVFHGDAAAAGTAERVEQMHLDVRERGQAAQQLVGVHRVEVVDQQPHPHAADRGVAQGGHQEPAGGVVLELVVLHVERHRRPLRQLHPRVEGEGAERQHPHPRLALAGRGDLGDLHERAVGVERQGLRVVPADVGGSVPQPVSKSDETTSAAATK